MHKLIIRAIRYGRTDQPNSKRFLQGLSSGPKPLSYINKMLNLFFFEYTRFLSTCFQCKAYRGLVYLNIKSVF